MIGGVVAVVGLSGLPASPMRPGESASADTRPSVANDLKLGMRPFLEAEPRPAGLVTSEAFESHPAFDPRNGDLYFVRSTPSFSGWKIMVARCVDGGWSEPVPAGFSGEGVDADPFFTADGRYVYFISSRPDPPAKETDDLDIWRAARRENGGWGEAERLPEPINSDAQEWFPRIARDGELYFGSDRRGGFGLTDIYRALPRSGVWVVQNVGPPVSTSSDEYEFERSDDGTFAILMSDGMLFHLEASEESWQLRRRLFPGSDAFHVGPSLSRDGARLLFSRRTADRSGEIFSLRLSQRWESNASGC